MKKLNLHLSKDEYKSVCDNLHGFYTEFPLLFQQIFQQNQVIEYKGDYLDILAKSDIVSRVGNMWSATYSIYRFRNLQIVTDSFLLPQIDRVFPLSRDESIFLANKINVKKGDQVLDIGTGSGIYAISAAKEGALVTAVDINDKALNYASFNSMINGVSKEIEFHSSDVFTSMNKKFNYIISNPAIIPAAEGAGFYIHSDGGNEGTKMSFKILEQFTSYLLPGGKLQMLATSYSSKKGKMVVEEFIRNRYSGSKFKFNIQELYSPSLDSLSSLTVHFKGTEGYNGLVRYIEDRKLSSLHYLFITAEEGSSFQICWEKGNTDFQKTEQEGSWEARLNRLFMVYQTIVVKGTSDRMQGNRQLF